jgi:hypothetical protein
MAFLETIPAGEKSQKPDSPPKFRTFYLVLQGRLQYHKWLKIGTFIGPGPGILRGIATESS